jgi:hypothetical protein
MIFPVAAQGVSNHVLSFSPSVLFFPFKKGDSIYCPLHLTNTTDEYVAFRLEHNYSGSKTTRELLKLPECGIVPPRSTFTLVVATKYIFDHYELEEMGIEDLVLRSTIRREQIRQHKDVSWRVLKPGEEYYYSKSVKYDVALKAFCTPPRGMVMSTLTLNVTSSFESLYIAHLYLVRHFLVTTLTCFVFISQRISPGIIQVYIYIYM